MEPSEILREEHEVITHLLHVLDAIADEVARGVRVPARDIDAVLEVVVNFADKCHHAKEEKALFPALAKASPKEGALVARRLEGDHRAARRLVAALRDAAPGVEAGDGAARASFAKAAKTYAALLHEHISQETKQLFPLVDRAIPARERQLLAEEFGRIEREETGAGLHEKYESTIHRLADTYVHGEGRRDA